MLVASDGFIICAAENRIQLFAVIGKAVALLFKGADLDILCQSFEFLYDRLFEVCDAIVVNGIVRHILIDDLLTGRQHIYLYHSIVVGIKGKGNVLLCAVFVGNIHIEHVGLHIEIAVGVLVQHRFGHILDLIGQACGRRININVPIVLQFHIEIKGFVVDFACRKHTEGHALQAVDLDGCVGFKAGIDCCVKQGQGACKVCRQVVFTCFVAPQYPGQSLALLATDAIDFRGSRGQITACHRVHQRHSVGHIQGDRILLQGEVGICVVDNVQLYIEEFLQIGSCGRNVDNGDNIRFGTAATAHTVIAADILHAGNMTGLAVLIHIIVNRLAAVIIDLIIQDLRIVTHIADAQRRCRAVGYPNRCGIHVPVSRIVYIDACRHDLIKGHTGDLKFARYKLFLDGGQGNGSGCILQHHHILLDGKVAGRIHTHNVGALGQLHSSHTAAVGVHDSLVIAAQIKIDRNVGHRVIVLVHHHHVQNAQGLPLVDHHSRGLGMAKTVVIGYGQGDGVGACGSVFLDGLLLVGGGAVAKIPVVGLNGHIILRPGSIKEFFTVYHHIRRRVHNSGRRCILMYIYVFCCSSQGGCVLQNVHCLHLISEGSALLFGNGIDKGIAAVGSGSAGA